MRQEDNHSLEIPRDSSRIPQEVGKDCSKSDEIKQLNMIMYKVKYRNYIGSKKAVQCFSPDSKAHLYIQWIS